MFKENHIIAKFSGPSRAPEHQESEAPKELIPEEKQREIFELFETGKEITMSFVAAKVLQDIENLANKKVKEGQTLINIDGPTWSWKNSDGSEYSEIIPPLVKHIDLLKKPTIQAIKDYLEIQRLFREKAKSQEKRKAIEAAKEKLFQTIYPEMEAIYAEIGITHSKNLKPLPSEKEIRDLIKKGYTKIAPALDGGFQTIGFAMTNPTTGKYQVLEMVKDITPAQQPSPAKPPEPSKTPELEVEEEYEEEEYDDEYNEEHEEAQRKAEKSMRDYEERQEIQRTVYGEEYNKLEEIYSDFEDEEVFDQETYDNYEPELASTRKSLASELEELGEIDSLFESIIAEMKEGYSQGSTMEEMRAEGGTIAQMIEELQRLAGNARDKYEGDQETMALIDLYGNSLDGQAELFTKVNKQK